MKLKVKATITAFMLTVLLNAGARAQQNRSFAEHIRTVETIVNDVTHFAEIHNIGNYDMSSIIQRLDLADINDCLYFDYCTKENVDFYTFDSDLKNLGNNRQLHCFLAAENKWS